MKTGKVKFFNQEKGYGFIIDDETGKEIFVHATDCRQNIKTDDQVKFDVGHGKKGPLAQNVQLN